MAKPTKYRGKWRVRWVDENGVQRSGGIYKTFREADVQQKLLEAKVGEIKLGLRSPTPADRKFSELCDYWERTRIPSKRSGDSDQSIIRKHLRPAFGHILLKSIGRECIDLYRGERSSLDPKTLANHLTLLISMLRTAVELNWLLKAPRIVKPKIRHFSTEYRYLKSSEEIRRFLAAALVEGDDVFSFYATAVYTGLRAGELAALTRESINFERRLIVVQRSFTGPTKAEDVRYVPILDSLLPILRDRVNHASPRGILFPNASGSMHQESARIFQEVLHRVLKRAGFPKVTIKNKEREYIRFHDLRHTFASHWVAEGGDLFKLQKVLGHKSTQMTQRYAHLTPDAYASDYGRLTF